MTKKTRRNPIDRVAYAIVSIVSLCLLSGWVFGASVGEWSATQNRVRHEFPAWSPTSAADQSTYVSLELALGDAYRWKLPIVRSLNTAVLVATGLPLTTPVVSGTLFPSFFPSGALGTNLFYSAEFTLACGRDMSRMRSGLASLNRAAELAGKPALFVVVPDKSTVMMESNDMWHAALTACASAGRADLRQLASDFPLLVQVDKNDVTDATPGVAYWSGDTHWKPSAARALVSAVAQRLPGVAVPPVADGIAWTFAKPQDLLQMLAIEGTDTESTTMPQTEAVNLTSQETSGGGEYWTFERPNAPTGSRTALIVVDSFTYGAGITPALASEFSSGYVIPWGAFSELPHLNATDVIVIESVERAAYGRLPQLEDPLLLDYVARTR